MIGFNEPIFVKEGIDCINEAIIKNRRLNGDGPFTEKCTKWFNEKLGTRTLLTTSCTHALEMSAMMADIKEGDEVIMPSFTFVSTANAFVLHGAKIKFVDIRKDTMNIDEKLIESAITAKTKAIVVVHYAGVSCEMDTINAIAKKHKLFVIEDAAQGMMSTYKGRPLGTIGDFGAYSFHETKNYTMGEGGLCIINDNKYFLEAEIIREKGTNRTQFFRGEIDKYSWVNKGSSYLPSEMNAAYLYPQLKMAEEINNKRLKLWEIYYDELSGLMQEGKVELPYIPAECKHNAHMFYVKAKDIDERTKILSFLKSKGIHAVFHYVPLHTSTAGLKYSEFVGEDKYTSSESDRLFRLPMFYGLSEEDALYVAKCVNEFYRS